MKKVYRLVALVALLVSAENVLSGNISITFDDAPMPDSKIMKGTERTQRLIDALADTGVEEAWFFVTTGYIEEHDKGRLNLYVSAGHHLANHTHTHQSASKLTVHEFMVDVYQAHLKLKSFKSTEPYFRFPYLHWGGTASDIQKIQNHFSELNYLNGYITIGNYDWYMNSILNKAVEEGRKIDYEKFGDVYVKIIWESIKHYDNIARQTLGRSPKHVLLLHENDTSALFVKRLITHIKSNGWKIISPKEAYTDPIAQRLPKTAFHNQGRVAALAHEKGIDGKTLINPVESQEYLDALFESEGVFIE